jgi:hypothetical protein
MKLVTNNQFFLIKEELPQDNKLAVVGEREYKICLSDNIVLGSNKDFYYLTATNPKIYSFKEINKTTFDSLTDEEELSRTLILAFSRVLYSLGELYLARDTLNRCGDRVLMSRFKDASTTKEIIVAIDHIDAFLLKRRPNMPFVKNPGQVPSCDLNTLFKEMKKACAKVDIVQLNKIYLRKSPSKKYGSLDPEGNFIPCSFETRSVTREWADFINHEFTRNGEFNISLKENVSLFDKILNQEVLVVGGITLNLNSYKSYNLYDKEGCRIKTLLVRVDNKYLDEFELKTGLNSDFFEEGPHTDHFMFEINIEDTPIISDIVYADTDPKRLIALTITTDFLRGLLKENKPSVYTQEQLDELAKYYITPSMNFSPPSITDKSITTPNSTKIDFGSKELNVLTGNFKSGNFYLDRRFKVDGVEKLSLPMLLESNFNMYSLTEKVLGAKFKVDSAESLVIGVYKYLFNLSEDKGILGEYIEDRLKDALLKRDLVVLNNIQKEYNKELDSLYENTYIPIILGKKLNSVDYGVVLNKDLDNTDYLYEIKS